MYNLSLTTMQGISNRPDSNSECGETGNYSDVSSSPPPLP